MIHSSLFQLKVSPKLFYLLPTVQFMHHFTCIHMKQENFDQVFFFLPHDFIKKKNWENFDLKQ